MTELKYLEQCYNPGESVSKLLSNDITIFPGTPLDKMPVSWAPNEPDNSENSEDCLVMLPNGTLADVACSEVYPFFCYKKKAKHMFVVGCGTVDTGK